MDKKEINIGILGLGTVGKGVLKVLRENQDFINEGVMPYEIKVKKIADKNKNIILEYKNDAKILTDSVEEVINDPDIDIVVETIGGFEPSRSIILKALKKGKHVVTANKEVVAKAGYEILSLANEKKLHFLFEASVASAIPIIGAFSRSLTSYPILEIAGILNGTTNYILTKMSEEGRGYQEVLEEAQKKGFAEADPSKDIDGFDSLYKIFILSMIVFKAKINLHDIYCEGIRNISKTDIEYAKELGYKIKLLALAENKNQELNIKVHPALLPVKHHLASIDGAYNGILTRGNGFGDLTFSGLGAGSLPAGSMIISDIIEIVKSYDNYFNKFKYFKERKVRNFTQTQSSYYLRIRVKDRPGVLADIAGSFTEKRVSFASVIQKGEAGEIVDIVFLTHKAKEGNVQVALKKVAKLKCVEKICNVIRVVDV